MVILKNYIMDWYLKVMQNHYVDFKGRARRKEFWMFALIYFIMIVLAMVLDNMLGLNFEMDGVAMPYGYLYLFIAITHLMPYLSVSVRRLHDCDKSGWLLLLGVVPIVNLIGAWVILYFYCKNGTSGENQFGLDPKA